MRILINTPNWKRPELGGVANHYYGLRPYWTENVRYNIVGSRNKPGTGKYWLPYDLIKTVFKILFFRPNVVMVNTSLGNNALRRDAIFMNLAHAMGKKVVVHFHGFNVNYAKEINVPRFLEMFQNASGFIVLSNAIKKQLEDWGVRQSIYLSTTKVDERMLDGFDMSCRNGEIKNVLYLGRMEREKGIYISLDIYKLLQQEHPELQFTVVGNGSELEAAKCYAGERGINNITFTGALTGKALSEQYQKADLYLFTSFHEGMPTSVLEAMCFGLPVVTRPVGGLVDFFENGKMGQMVDSFDAVDFVQPIEDLLKKPLEVKAMSEYNHDYGVSHFLASNVAMHIEQILRELC